jgi:hypothetical protein
MEHSLLDPQYVESVYEEMIKEYRREEMEPVSKPNYAHSCRVAKTMKDNALPRRSSVSNIRAAFEKPPPK